MSTMKKGQRSKKEKSVAAMVASALVAVPIVVASGPSQYALAIPSAPPAVLVDRIQDFALPVFGSSAVIDLNYVFDHPFDLSVISTDSDDSIAVIDEEYLNAGFLKINAKYGGTVTFTLEFLRDTGDGFVAEKEQFNVTVGPLPGSDGRFDVGDAVSYMNVQSGYNNTTAVKSLLSGIGTQLDFYAEPGNHAPLAEPIPVQIVNAYEEVAINDLLQGAGLSDYFHDIDAMDNLTYYITTSDESVASVYSDGEDNWTLYSSDPGEATIKVFARDSRGAYVESSFLVKVNKPFPSYHISPGRTVDVDVTEYFQPADPDDTLTFQYQTFSSTGSSTHDMSGSTFTLTSSTDHIAFIARDSSGHEQKQDVYVMDDDIVPNVHLYENSQLDFNLAKMFNVDYATNFSITPTSIDSVTADVYLNSHHIEVYGKGQDLTSRTVLIDAVSDTVVFADSFEFDVLPDPGIDLLYLGDIFEMSIPDDEDITVDPQAVATVTSGTVILDGPPGTHLITVDMLDGQIVFRVNMFRSGV